MDSTNDSGIKWGAEIAVDGVRPEWLTDDDQIVMHHDCTDSDNGDYWYGSSGHWKVSEGFWAETDLIRLPADHPHYQKQAAPKVDWSKPIEAVHVDGRVVPAKTGERDDIDPGTGRYIVNFEGDGNGVWFLDSGEPNIKLGWTIRNVQTPKAATPAIDPALVERMVALVREVGEVWPAGFERHTKEARDIIKSLEPVDSAALQAAKEIAQRRNLLPVNEMEVQNSVIETLMEAIQRGRQLEREETNA